MAIRVAIVGSWNGAALKRAERELGSLKRTAEKAGNGMAGGLYGMSGGLLKFSGATSQMGDTFTRNFTVPILGGGAYAVKAASDLAESQNKAKVVFGESAGVISSWASSSATDIGLSRQAALDAAGTYGNLFDTMGLGDKASANMSKNLVNLSGDLASFNNANPADVLDAIKSGLVGETEPMRRFGVNLNESTLKAEALRLGLMKGAVDMVKVRTAQANLLAAQEKHNKVMKDSKATAAEKAQASAGLARAEQAVAVATKGATGDLTAAQKAQAAYSLMMQQTKNAQGDFERTSDGLANKQRILKAQFQDSAAALGVSLMPAATQMMGSLSQLADKFAALSPSQQAMIGKVALAVAAIGPLLKITGGLAGGLSKAAKMGGDLALAFGEGAGAAPKWASAIASGVKGAADLAKGIATAVANLGRQAIAWTVDTARRVANAAATAAHTAAQIAANVATKAWAAGQWLLNAAMTANPIGIVVALIVGLVAVIVVLWKKNEGFRRVVIAGWNAIKTAGVAAWNAVKTGVSKAFNFIVNLFMNTTLPGLVIKNWDKIKAGASKAWAAIRNTVTKLWDSLVDQVKRRLTFWGNIGHAIVEGLKNGITNAWRSLISKFKGLVDLLPAAVKKILGIQSPSRVFARFGENIAQGLINGMVGRRSDIQFAANRMAVSAVPSLQGFGAAGRSAMPSGFSPGGSRTVVIARGAIQIILPDGSDAQTARAAGEGTLEALARELGRY